MENARTLLGCGVVVLLGLAATAILMINVGAMQRFSRGLDVELLVEDATGLAIDGEVVVAGVKVGSIRDVRLEGGSALLMLRLEPDATLRQDIRARVRMRSLLGEKYVELMPTSDTAPLLTGGERLEPAAPQIDIDEMIAMIAPLLETVDGQTFGALMGHLKKALDEDPEALGRMVGNMDELLANGAEASGDLRDLLARGRRSLAAMDEAVVAIERRAAQLEGTLTQAEATLAGIDRASEPVPALVANAGAAVDEVRAAVGPTRAAAEDLAAILEAFEDLDPEYVHQVLREDGVRVHLFGRGRNKEDR